MQRIHEELQLLAVVTGTANSTPLTTSWVDTKDVHELMGIAYFGDMASETIDFKIEQATDSSGTGAKDLKAATQRSASASANDSKQIVISAMSDKLDSNNGFRYVRLRAVTGGATGGAANLAIWARPVYKPATQPASIVEVAVA